MRSVILGGYFGFVISYLGVLVSEPRFWVLVVIFAVLVEASKLLDK